MTEKETAALQAAGRLCSEILKLFPWLEPRGTGFAYPPATPAPSLALAYNAYMKATEETNV